MHSQLCIILIAHLALPALLAALASTLLAATHEVVVLDGLVGLLNACLERAEAVADADFEATHDEAVLVPTGVVTLIGVALHRSVLAVEEAVGAQAYCQAVLLEE